MVRSELKMAIIAAGEGSRMESEGITVPKPLVAINGKPLIQRIIESGRYNGITDICCLINNGSLNVYEFLARYMLEEKFDIDINVKTTPSSLHSFYELKGYLDLPFILTTVDSVFIEEEFTGFIERVNLLGNSVDCLLGVTNFIDDEKPLCLKFDEDNNVKSFHNEKGFNKWATGGIYYFHPRVFKEMEKSISEGDMRLRVFLKRLLSKGAKMEVYKFSKIIDVDHAEDIKKAEIFDYEFNWKAV